MVINYKARVGAPFSEKKAQVYGEEIERLKIEKGGELKSFDVVEAAKLKDSVLHDYFTWNDDEAGRQWRLQQARNLVSHIVQVVIDENNKEVEQRSFYSVRNERGEPVYVTIKQVEEEPSYRKQLVDKIIVQMENATTLLRMFKNTE